MASSNTYNTPCAACKFLRRKCMPGCIFAPYFPPEEPQKFANVHKIFGASNVTKLLNDILPHQREDAVNSLAYEAEARVRDPVYGCVGAISFLQMQVDRLQKELDSANADLIRYATPCTDHHIIPTTLPPAAAAPSMAVHHHPSQRPVLDGGTASSFYQTPTFSFTYPLPWTSSSYDHNPSSGDISGGEAGGGGGI